MLQARAARGAGQPPQQQLAHVVQPGVLQLDVLIRGRLQQGPLCRVDGVQGYAASQVDRIEPACRAARIWVIPDACVLLLRVVSGMQASMANRAG